MGQVGEDHHRLLGQVETLIEVDTWIRADLRFVQLPCIHVVGGGWAHRENDATCSPSECCELSALNVHDAHIEASGVHIHEPVLNQECFTHTRAGGADDVLCFSCRAEVDEVRAHHLLVDTKEGTPVVIHALRVR